MNILSQASTVELATFDTSHFDAYQDWAKRFKKTLSDYELWLEGQDLSTKKVRKAIVNCRPHIRVVITGEFGRGKTEIINALFASHAGMRLLPVQVGRATMTPTEFMYNSSARPYVKYLPIDTLAEEGDLEFFLKHPDRWRHISLDTKNPEQMRKALAGVAELKTVTKSQAEVLGFSVSMLEPADDEDKVLVPAWRYALVNLDFPILKAGLSLVDTPGLNAVGVESVVPVELVHRAQALMHILSIETGVTASDLKAWQETILPVAKLGHMPLFAAINKLDLLDSAEESVAASVERIKRFSGRKLNLSDDKFFVLSARFAVQGCVENDTALQKRSGYLHFRQALMQRLPQERLKHMRQGILAAFLAEIKKRYTRLDLEKRRHEKDLNKLNDSQYDVETHHLKTKNMVSHLEEQILKNKSFYEENNRNIELSLEHVMHIFSDQQFEAHKQRAASILGQDGRHATAEVEKARNIMVSSMKLDLRRIDMDMKVLNNSMRALFQDLTSDFEPSDISVAFFSDAVTSMEKVQFSVRNDALQEFSAQVVEPLYQSFRKQRKLIAAWHASHIDTVKQPLDDEVAHLEEQRHTEKVLSERIEARAKHLELVQKRLPEVKTAMKALHAIELEMKKLSR